MGRVISQEKIAGILQARKDDPDALGPMLGELVLQGNVPIAVVASLMAVSEPTIYRWMYGHSIPMDKDKVAKIKRLLTVLRKAKRAKDLPMNGTIKDRSATMRELVITHGPLPART